MKNSQKGSVTTVLLVIIIILLVIIGGMYAYENQKIGATATIDNSTQPLAAQPASQSQQTAVQPQSTASSGANHSSQIAVTGMSKYTDQEFGFSFWYPSDWQVTQVSLQNPNKYLGGIVEKQLNITGQQRVITIEEYVSSGSTITDSTGVGACPVCTTTRYYFNFNLHTWMASFPDDTTSGMYDGTPYVAGSSIPANVSLNTMGGLHMLAGSMRFGANTIIPLSANDFLIIAVDGQIATGSSDPKALTKTIVALDPAVATPVSQVQQEQTIQAEASAFATSHDPDAASVAPVPNGWQTYANSYGNFSLSFQYPSSLNSSYATLSNPPLVTVTLQKSGNPSIDSNGCWIPSIYSGEPSSVYSPTQVNINGISFCQSDGLNPGAGSISGYYYFTTAKDGEYVTIGYRVGAPNGCGVLMGESGYQACENFESSYNDIVIKPLQQSAGTLTFTN